MLAEQAQTSATRALVDFALRAKDALELSPTTRHAALRAFVNIVGCCLGGAHHEIVNTASAALLPFSGPQSTTLLGRGERADVLTATLLNCLSSAAYSFDDTHAQAILHPSGAVASCLLALAEQRAIHGADFHAAFVVGVEVACRLSKAVSVPPAEGDIAWSQTGIAAGVGAAMAAARVLGLDRERTTWALGIAASQASGFRVVHGTMCSTLVFGHAAHTGLRAAILAQHGLTAPAAPIEGKFGFASVFAVRSHLDYVVDGLGTRFELEQLTYKPYPCGIVIHPALDCALNLQRRHSLDPRLIEHVAIRVHPSAKALGFRRHPATVLEAKVSLFHWVAVALARCRSSIEEGKDVAIRDATVTALRDKIELIEDATLAADAAQLTVTAAGNRMSIAVEHCKGSIANPMTDLDINDKFLGQAETELGSERAAELLDRCWRLDQLSDAGQIAILARPKA